MKVSLDEASLTKILLDIVTSKVKAGECVDHTIRLFMVNSSSYLLIRSRLLVYEQLNRKNSSDRI